MRIYLELKSQGLEIPFDHQPLMVGTIYKWLGRSILHDRVSLYSFSRLEGGKMLNNNLIFNNSCSFFISAYEDSIIKKLVAGILKDTDMFYGLKVSNIYLMEDPNLTKRELFFPASPIFIKRRVEDKIEHFLFDHPLAGEYLKQTLLTKMKNAGINDETLELNFFNKNRKGQRKLVRYNGINNIASLCPVVIHGKPETKLFAWNVGLGNSTGIGFGAIE